MCYGLIQQTWKRVEFWGCDMFKVVEEVVRVVLSTLWKFKTLFAMSFMTGVACALCDSTVELLVVVIGVLILAMLGMLLSEYHRITLRNFYAANKKRRFVYLDEYGNKKIRFEDMPEIIQYLYEIEEDNSRR